MHAVILAAGEGSRMGPHTADVPKAFMEVAGRSLYERQCAAIERFVDDVTIVLGYAYENVLDRVDGARTIVFEDWERYENAESLRRAIVGIDDDVLVLNGDVVVTAAAVGHVIERFESGSDRRSAVAVLPGEQSEATAVQADDDGRVVQYGLISGRRHAGFGALAESRLDRAEEYLRAHCDEWYPGLYTEVPTDAVAIPSDHHLEINYPRDRIVARRELPFDAGPEIDQPS